MSIYTFYSELNWYLHNNIMKARKIKADFPLQSYDNTEIILLHHALVMQISLSINNDSSRLKRNRYVGYQPICVSFIHTHTLLHILI